MSAPSEEESDLDWNEWDEIEDGKVKSLFSDETFSSVKEALDFDASQYDFDVRRWKQEVCVRVCARASIRENKRVLVNPPSHLKVFIHACIMPFDCLTAGKRHRV